MNNKKTFTINQKENPTSKRPFGESYGGEFTVRRPTLADKRTIAMMEHGAISSLGPVEVAQMPTDVVNMNYIFSHLDVLCEDRPDWCYIDKLYEGDDEQAVYAVWQEVKDFLDRFRSGKTTNDDGAGKTGGETREEP